MANKSLKTFSLAFALLACVSASAQNFDSELQLSTNVTYWYRICSAAPGMESYAMTDLYSETKDDISNAIHLLPTEAENHRSQWKLTAGEDGKVIITNRETGRQISNTSLNEGDHNVTWLSLSGTTGLNITSLGDYAFQLESVENDGVNRCLALADISGEPLTYPESAKSTSFIGWKFFPVEINTGIGSAKAGSTIVQVKNKRIFVTGCPEWQLFNAQGEEMPRTVSLATGVYMVKTQQRTVKVLIP